MEQELILIRITGEDRPGLTAGFMAIMAKYDVDILDIGQADIHSTLSLGILIRPSSATSGQRPVLSRRRRRIQSLGGGSR